MKQAGLPWTALRAHRRSAPYLRPWTAHRSAHRTAQTDAKDGEGLCLAFLFAPFVRPAGRLERRNHCALRTAMVQGRRCWQNPAAGPGNPIPTADTRLALQAVFCCPVHGRIVSRIPVSIALSMGQLCGRLHACRFRWTGFPARMTAPFFIT